MKEIKIANQSFQRWSKDFLFFEQNIQNGKLFVEFWWWIDHFRFISGKVLGHSLNSENCLDPLKKNPLKLNFEFGPGPIWKETILVLAQIKYF